MTAASLPVGEQRSRALRGAAYLVATVSIWAGWLLSTRLGVRADGVTPFTPWDITALRFLVAGLVLLPVVWRRGFGWRGTSPLWYALLIAGTGAPYTVLVSTAMTFAPASHAGALLPGTMPLIVAVLAWALLRDRIDRARLLGLGLILAGVLVLVGRELLDTAMTGSSVSIGHLLLLLSATLWALTTLAMRHIGLAPVHAIAVVAVLSLVLYLPPYLIVSGRHFLALPLGEALFHGFYQGVLTSAVSLVAYMRGIALLGPARASAFGALVPVMVAVLGIPLLGEWPQPAAWLAVLFTASGVMLASGVARAVLTRRQP